MGQAFSRQARADFEAFEAITTVPVAVCHRLLFLQMACEKLELVKAHLLAAGADAYSLQSSHAYVAQTLPSFCASKWEMWG